MASSKMAAGRQGLRLKGTFTAPVHKPSGTQGYEDYTPTPVSVADDNMFISMGMLKSHTLGWGLLPLLVSV